MTTLLPAILILLLTGSSQTATPPGVPGKIAVLTNDQRNMRLGAIITTATNLAAAGQHDAADKELVRAVQTTRDAPNIATQFLELTRISLYAARAEMADRARRIADEAMTLATQVPRWERFTGLRTLLQTRLLIGDNALAESIMAQFSDPLDIGRTFEYTAESFWKAGKKDKAAEYFVRAHDTMQKISSLSERANALSELAKKQHDLGDLTGAVTTMNSSVAAMKKLTPVTLAVDWLVKSANKNVIGQRDQFIAEAKAVTSPLEPSPDKVSALVQIAIAEDNATPGAGKATIMEAERTVTQIATGDEQALALQRVGQGWAGVGDIPAALALADTMLLGFPRVTLLQTIAERYKWQKDPVGERTMLFRIRDQIRSARHEKAVTTANRSSYNNAWGNAVIRLGEMGDITAARAFASETDDLSERASLQARLSSVLARSGNQAEAVKMIQEALPTAESIPNPLSKMDALRIVADFQTRLDRDGAARTYLMARTIMINSLAPGSRRAEELLKFAYELDRNRFTDISSELITDVGREVRALKKIEERSLFLLQLATWYKRKEQVKDATTAILEARQDALQIPHAPLRVQRLTAILFRFLVLERDTDFRETVPTLGDRFEQMRGFDELINHYGFTNDDDQWSRAIPNKTMEKVSAFAKEVVNGCTDKREQELLRRYLAALQAKQRLTETARSTALSISDFVIRAEALVQIAHSQYRYGDDIGGAKTVEQAKSVARRIKDPYWQAMALLIIAENQTFWAGKESLPEKETVKEATQLLDKITDAHSYEQLKKTLQQRSVKWNDSPIDFSFGSGGR